MRLKHLALIGTTAFLSISGCGSRELHIDVPANFSAISAITLRPKCSQCHPGVETHQGVLAIVEAGKPTDSKLVEVIEEGSMPMQSPKLSDKEINAIKQWITNGALND